MKDLIQYFKEDVFDTTVKSIGNRDYLLDYFRKICSVELDLSIINNILLIKSTNSPIEVEYDVFHEFLNMCDLCDIEKIVFGSNKSYGSVIIYCEDVNLIDFHKIPIEAHRGFVINMNSKDKIINTIKNLYIKCDEDICIEFNENKSLKKYENFVIKDSDLNCEGTFEIAVLPRLGKFPNSVLPNIINTKNKIKTIRIDQPINVYRDDYNDVSNNDLFNDLEIERLINYKSKWNFEEVRVVLCFCKEDHDLKQPQSKLQPRRFVAYFKKHGAHLSPVDIYTCTNDEI